MVECPKETGSRIFGGGRSYSNKNLFHNLGSSVHFALSKPSYRSHLLHNVIIIVVRHTTCTPRIANRSLFAHTQMVFPRRHSRHFYLHAKNRNKDSSHTNGDPPSSGCGLTSSSTHSSLTSLLVAHCCTWFNAKLSNITAPLRLPIVNA